jgi:hypothetical protein
MPGCRAGVTGRPGRERAWKKPQDQAAAPPASPGVCDGHRRPVRGKMEALEGRWLMGRAAPRELLEGIGRYLRLETPERKDELLVIIRARWPPR